MKGSTVRAPAVLVALLGLAPLGAGQGLGSADELVVVDEAFELDLTQMSLEDLMDIEVSVASRSAEPLSKVPAAVYVLTGDEIRRSGHSTIQEALRMVPGFYVSHWTTPAWDVTSRGFGTGTALTSLAFLNELLVMVDGMVVYTPLFASTWWPLQDVDIDDVDRVEIVRGPGGIFWGSNAIHGVVHIITKSAADTQGRRVSARTSRDDHHVSMRQGGPLGENGYYRAWVDYVDWDTLHNPFLGFDQDWWLGSLGFRADWEANGNEYTFWSRGYEGEFDRDGFDLTFFVPVQVTNDKYGFQSFYEGRNPEAQSRWHVWFSTDRQDLMTLTDIVIDTLDVEYQRQFELGSSNRLTVGAGHRIIHSDLTGDDPFFLDFDPTTEVQNNTRVFALDVHELADNLDLTLGLSLENHAFTGLEVQPSARLAWWPTADLMLWTSATRAVRTPSLEENSLSEGSFFVGSKSFDSEVLFAYEIGCRTILGNSASVDLAAFFNDYDDLHFRDPQPSGQFVLTNEAEGEAYGAELAVDFQPTDRWRLRSAYSLLDGEYTSKLDGSNLSTDNYSPRHLFNIRSYYDLAEDWELDMGFYYVDDLDQQFEIAEYDRTDVRLSWHPSEALEVYAGGQNLTDPTHSEFDQFDNTRRTYFAGLRWEP